MLRFLFVALAVILATVSTTCPARVWAEGVEPTRQPTPTPAKPTRQPTPTFSPAIEPTREPTPHLPWRAVPGTPSPTAKPTRRPTPTPSPTAKPTRRPTPTPSPTAKPTREPTSTPPPTTKPTRQPTPTPSPTTKPTRQPTPHLPRRAVPGTPISETIPGTPTTSPIPVTRIPSGSGVGFEGDGETDQLDLSPSFDLPPVVGLAGLLLVVAFWLLERVYRQRKSLKLQQSIAQRQARVEELLAEPDGWRQVLSQLLADVLDRSVLIGQEGVLELSLEPAPRYAVAGEAGIEYWLTTQPLQGIRLPGRKEQVVPLDAALHPAARMEAQMLWEHLAAGQANGSLPRQTAWFLEVHRRNWV